MAPRPTAPDHAIASHRRCRRRGITARVQSGCGHGPVPWGLSGRYTHVVDFTDGSQLAEFELVWPVPLDVTLMDAVQHACDRVKPGTKRKPHDTSMSAVHLKLRKLGL